MSEKASKAEANYRAGTADKRCSVCTMFRLPASCTAVSGAISPAALCDYFKRRADAKPFGALA